VLRLLRRRSLARLRREVEPVDPAALARFLPDWHGVASVGSAQTPFRGSGALERLAEVVDQLAGLPIPASVLERDVLPARIPGYQPRLLDELGSLGEVGWVGRGSLGRDDGRIALLRPGREALRPATFPDDTERPADERHERIRAHLARRGASFYREIHAAAGGGPDRDVLDALWDLVWAGEVTNDTFAPLRALRWKRTGRDARRRPGRLTSLGPPEAAGRWSLVEPVAATTPTERLHAQSLALLERHGVLTREAVVGEGIEGGFSAVYPVLRALEEAGRIRRGYFVDGLGAAQFALAGSLDRLRAVRDPSDADPAARTAHVLAAADPANPYGAALPWPRRGDDDRRPLQRAAGAYVVLIDGEAAVYLERGGATLQVLAPADDPAVAAAAFRALGVLVADGRFRELVITKVDGAPIAESPLRQGLLASGFVPGYRGLTLRPGTAGAAAARR
jgi:ATP-dependent Lhr-like helicase